MNRILKKVGNGLLLFCDTILVMGLSLQYSWKHSPLVCALKQAAYLEFLAAAAVDVWGSPLRAVSLRGIENCKEIGSKAAGE
jgi:hypothetical protein